MKRYLPSWHGAAALGFLLLIWELVVGAGIGNRPLLPPPSSIAATIGHLFSDGEIFEPLLVTASRLLVGFIICTFVGVALGILTGSIDILHEAIGPMLEVIRSLPKVALVPALILLFGIGDLTKIISIVLAGLFPVWVNVVRSVRDIDPILHDSARTLALTRFAKLRKITFPAILPDAFAGARIALGLCFVVAVLSEMTIGSDGLGALIVDTQRAFRVRHMYAWVFILAAFGFGMNALLVWAERNIVFWTGTGFEQQKEKKS